MNRTCMIIQQPKKTTLFRARTGTLKQTKEDTRMDIQIVKYVKQILQKTYLFIYLFILLKFIHIMVYIEQ